MQWISSVRTLNKARAIAMLYTLSSIIYHSTNKNSGLGTHISFVRSVTMDRWTPQQIALMRVGGNQKCKDFLQSHGIDTTTATIAEKYDSPAAMLYQQVLVARVESRAEPTELPEKTSSKNPLGKLQGFGSSPLPEPPKESVVKKVLKVAVPVVVVAGALLLAPR
jgi:hypothetical protein